MKGRQLETMRWVLFWVFVAILVATALVTLAIVLFGVGTTDPVERKMLLGVSVVQVISSLVALFYFLFGIKKEAQSGDIDFEESIVPGTPVNEQVPPVSIVLNPELEHLRAEIESLTALPDRIIGVLSAGQSLSLNALQSRLGIQADDRVQIAGLQACLGKLVTRRIVEH